MKRIRRTFSRKFKLKAVRYANSFTDQSMASLAFELEVDRQALWAWVKEVDTKGEEYAFPGSGRRQLSLLPNSRKQGADESLDEIESLHTENEMLQMKLERTVAERDVLQRVLERAIQKGTIGLGTKEDDS